MAGKSTFIKLDRNILRWCWYGNANVFRVFIHLLLTAETEKRAVDKHVLERGDALTSLDRMVQQLGMSKQEVRTALTTLKKTGDITCFQIGRNVIYHIENYDRYQGRQAPKQHESNTILTRFATRFATQLTTQLTTQFSEPQNTDGDSVSGVSEECRQHNFQHDFQHGLQHDLQHESNTILTQTERENEKEKEKEKRTKKEKDKEKAKEKVYIYNTHSLCAHAREASGEGEDTTDGIPLLKSYGKYGNVRLTEAEHGELCGEFGEEVANGAIDILDGHIQKRGAAFKSACHAVDIREWCVSKYRRLQAEKAELESMTPKRYPVGGSYRRMVTRVTGVERALTRQELACVNRWEADGVSEDLLTLAYEKTVAKTNKPQFVYMDKVLAGWKDKHLSTPAEVDAYFKNPDNRLFSGEASADRLDFSLDEIFERP